MRTQAFTATSGGDFVAAEGYWNELLQLFPENPAIWSNRGKLAVSQGKLQEAIAEFDQSIKLAPQITDVISIVEPLGKVESVGIWRSPITSIFWLWMTTTQWPITIWGMPMLEGGLA